VRRGLGYNEADVAVVTNISEDHLGCDGVSTLEELCHVKSLVVETVKPEGFAVLNAEDPMVARMAAKCPGQVIFFSATERKNRILCRHLAAGGRGVLVKEKMIVIADGGRQENLIDLSSIPITFGGAAGYNIANCLAATGALWGMDVDMEAIVGGLTSFDAMKDNPGRANLYDLGTYRVLLDYGHNIDGYRNVLNLVASFGPKRKVGVIGVPGDRKDSDIIEVGKICGRHLDIIYVKEVSIFSAIALAKGKLDVQPKIFNLRS